MKLFPSAFLPIHSQKYLIHKKINKRGMAIYSMSVLEGLDFSRSTAQKKFTDVDEFTYVFYSLNLQDRLLILSYVDPTDHFDCNKDWVYYSKIFLLLFLSSLML